ncbi:MAG: Isochorismatase hydrolase [uncultured bacterium]|nr:MAG: Isochorismatase hydrolase [uncultured bacterium]
MNKRFEKINPKKTALLVIDMQNDFVKKGAVIEVANARKILKNLQKFADECRKKKMIVIFTKHIYDPKKNPVEAVLFPELEKMGLRKNTYGADVASDLKIEKSDIVLEKNRYDAFYQTKLESILKKKSITDLIITGTMTNVCCESTARGAMMRDFNVWFCSDLTATSNKEKHLCSLKTIATHFGKVLKSSEIWKFLS